MQKKTEIDKQTTNNFMMSLRKPHWLSITLVIVAILLVSGGIIILRKERLASNFIEAIAVSPENVVWVGTSWEGVSRFDGQTWATFTEDDGLVSNEINSIVTSNEGEVWIASDEGVSRFDGETWTTFTAKDGLASNEVDIITVGTNGDVWIGTFDAGVSRFDGQTWATFSEREGLVDNDVRAITVTAEGDIWFGTTSGASYFDGQNWKTYTNEDGLATDLVLDIFITSDGIVWFLGEGKRSSLEGGTWTIHSDEDGWPQLIMSFARAPDGSLWVSSMEGISQFDGESWTKYNEQASIGFFVEDIAVAPDGSLWMGTGTFNTGVSHFDGQNWTSYSEDGGVPLGIGLIALSVLCVVGFGLGKWLYFRTNLNLSAQLTTQPPDSEKEIPISPEIRTAREWYRWLWLSALLTIPTLILVMYVASTIFRDLFCPYGFYNCSYETAFTLSGLIAVGFSSLWHLLLLIPSLNKESQFVRWHGRQAMILAILRTGAALIFLLASYASDFGFTSIIILISIWFFGTLFGQRQAARGDCSLMRWTGRADSLPGPPADEYVDGIEGLSTETLESTFRFSNDPQERREALEELKKRGLVEFE